jgi:hypothetical protein
MSVRYRRDKHWARIAADTRHVCEGVRPTWTGDAPVISMYGKVGQLLGHIRQTDTALAGGRKETA